MASDGNVMYAQLISQFEKLKKLKDQVIGVMSCYRKNCYGQDYINARLVNLCEEHELLETDVQKLKDWDQQIKTSKKALLSGRESTKVEKKVDIVISSDSELSSHSNSDDEVSNWEKEGVERKKPAKKNLKKAEERGKNVKQRPTTGKETLEPEKKKREIKDKAKSPCMPLLRHTNAHLFSKGAENQREVLPSIIKAEVSKSVGLIQIDTKAMGTGFRVGEKYIVTCAHVIKSAITGLVDFGLVVLEKMM